MGMIGSIVGAGTQLLGGLMGSIGSGVSARKAKKAQLQGVEEMGRLNEEMFNRNYYQDIMSRSDTQAALKAQRDLLRESLKQQQRTAAISGATPESIAAAQKGMNDSLAQTISGIQAKASMIKDNAYNNYMNQKSSLAQQKAEIEANAQLAKGQAWNQMGQAWNQMGQAVAESGNQFNQGFPM